MRSGRADAPRPAPGARALLPERCCPAAVEDFRERRGVCRPDPESWLGRRPPARSRWRSCSPPKQSRLMGAETALTPRSPALRRPAGGRSHVQKTAESGFSSAGLSPEPAGGDQKPLRAFLGPEPIKAGAGEGDLPRKTEVGPAGWRASWGLGSSVSSVPIQPDRLLPSECVRPGEDQGGGSAHAETAESPVQGDVGCSLVGSARPWPSSFPSSPRPPSVCRGSQRPWCCGSEGASPE